MPGEDEVKVAVKGQVDYFKTQLFVLVKAHGDTSTTGNFSWTQPSRLESRTLVLVALGPPSSKS